jgi:hypothetical protein
MAGTEVQEDPMDHRAKLASVAAVGATLCTGLLAAGATTGVVNAADPAPGPGVPLVVTPADARVESPAAGGTAGPEAGTAPAAAGRGVAGVAGVPSRAASPVAVAAVAGAPGPEAADSPASDEPDQPDEPPSTPPPSTPPTTVSNPPPTSPPECSGSDDGMTEAQKQAREAACHGGGDD